MRSITFTTTNSTYMLTIDHDQDTATIECLAGTHERWYQHVDPDAAEQMVTTIHVGQRAVLRQYVDGPVTFTSTEIRNIDRHTSVVTPYVMPDIPGYQDLRFRINYEVRNPWMDRWTESTTQPATWQQVTDFMDVLVQHPTTLRLVSIVKVVA